MQTKIQSVMNTLFCSPARHVTEGVKRYSSQLSRWVHNLDPRQLLNTPTNRAIAYSHHVLCTTQDGFDLSPPGWDTNLKGTPTTFTWDLCSREVYLRRTDLQHRLDLLCAPMLRMFIPADAKPESSENSPATVAKAFVNEDGTMGERPHRGRSHAGQSCNR